MQELEKWIAEDLAKSGLSGDDIEAVDETILEQMMEADGNSLNLKA